MLMRRAAVCQASMQALKKDLAPLQARAQAQDLEAIKEIRQLYVKHKISPAAMIAMPLLQMPVFLSFFLGLRRMAAAFPDAHSGGVLWFTDLDMVDASYTLPVISSASALLLVGLAMPAPPPGSPVEEQHVHSRMRMLLGGLTLVSFPVACNMPASVLVFWISNNLFSLVYSTAVLTPASRAALGLPPLPTATHSSTDLSPQMAAAQIDSVRISGAQEKAAASLAQLADAMAEGGQLSESADMHKRAHALSASAIGKEHVQTLRRLLRYAEVAEQAGLNEDAIKALQELKEFGSPDLSAVEIGLTNDVQSIDERISRLEKTARSQRETPDAGAT